MPLPHPSRMLPGNFRIFVAAVILYSALSAPFAGQWDSFDYLKQIVTHRPSDLGFGRPLFILYNAAIWEVAKKLLALTPGQAGILIQTVTLLLGAGGLLLFARLVSRLLSSGIARLAAMGMLLSPLYALYSGAVMTEVPMLVTAIGAANLLLPATNGRFMWGAILSGALFGVSAGIREQVLTMAGAFLWLAWIVPSDRSAKARSVLVWAAAAVTATVVPVVIVCLSDPAAFLARMQTWFRIIPTGGSEFARNLSAILLFAFLLCPASWLALAGAVLGRRAWPLPPHRSAAAADRDSGAAGIRSRISNASWTWGAVLSIGLPVAVLCRDADVQMHPRYALVILPGLLILCAGLYESWRPSRSAAAAWAVLHILLFGIAAAAIQPFRQAQYEKKAYVEQLRYLVPGEGLFVAGSYSPALDFYRATGVRPLWRIIWSGWGWERKAVEGEVHRAWSRGEPVYLCDGPYAWLYLEEERLDLVSVFRGRRAEILAPGLKRFTTGR